MGEETKTAEGSRDFLNFSFSRRPPALRNALDSMALGALAGAMLLWSGSFIAMKLALAEFHPALAVFARMLGSVFLLAPFAPRVARSLAHAGRDRRLFAILVLCEPCLYFIFEAYALKYTSASQAGVVTSLSPLLVGVGAFFILKERLSAFAWTGVFLAVSGVIWLTLAGEETTAAPNALLGNTLEFCAMLMACVYTLCVRKLMRYPPFFIAAVQAFGGTLFFGIIFAGTGFPLPERIPSLQALASLAFLSVVTILAYGLYNIGVARLSAARAAAWLNLIPALTLIMGIVFLGESLSAVQGLAIAPILAGVLLSLFGKTRPPLDESI